MLDELLSWLAPHYCYFCQKTGNAVCDCCKNNILRALRPGQFDFEFYQKTGEIAFLAGRRSRLKRLIYDYKLNSKQATAKVLAEVLDYVLDGEDVAIVPLSTSRKSRRQRGFGHMELVVQELAKRGYATVEMLTNRSLRAQKELSAQQRIVNIEHGLACVAKPCPEKRYLLIDDITTTGATLKTARRLLLRSGARQVACLALVHA